MKSKIKTELEALNVTIDMWSILAKTGQDKESVEQLFPLDDWVHDCALCEFYFDGVKPMKTGELDRKCKKCPLSIPANCGYEESLFHQWSEYIDEEDTRGAMEIADKIANAVENFRDRKYGKGGGK